MNRLIFIAACVLAWCGTAAWGQGLHMAWSTLDAGGVGRNNPSFAVVGPNTIRLSGTIGQFDTGVSTAIVGPNQYVLSAGYWVVGRVCPGQGPGACSPADLDENGAIDFNDFLAFMNLFNASDLCVDYDASGAIDFNDFLAFMNLFNAGC
ncbi:MAG: hypothetical protein FJ255_06465 [Phycisphaerae bacterium]|nr:hypothetical protein [Phycisphaerae bacterium]